MPKKVTNADFIGKVKLLTGDEYVFLQKYINARTKIKCRHNISGCGYEWNVSPDSFLRGTRCPICQHRGHKKTTDEFKEEVYNLVGEEYEVLTEYIGKNKKIKIKHNKCNTLWKVIPSNFLKGSRCPKCAGNIQKTTQLYKREVYDLTHNEYDVLGEYINTHTKIKMRHNICEYSWDITPASFLSGRRCPQCAESKGEEKIRLYLESKNQTYELQYSFSNLLGIGGTPLRFDFAILGNDGIPNCLIEYDGIFHYEKQYDKDGFETLQIHDERKNQYCKDNSIPLVRIPYWQFDKIEEILEKWLNATF